MFDIILLLIVIFLSILMFFSYFTNKVAENYAKTLESLRKDLKEATRKNMINRRKNGQL